jgi:SAM-dependent methyltransferase
LTGDIGRKEIEHLYRVYRQRERVTKAAILDVIEPRAHGRLLDCGCGDGDFTVQVACRARVSEAYGIEHVEARIRQAFERGVIVTKGDLNDPLPYKSRFFNIVHANHITEDLLNIDLFLAEMKRVLRPDGYAILSVNNLASWHSRFSLASGTLAPPLHVTSDATPGNGSDALHASYYVLQSDSRALVFSFQDLAGLCHYHGFWVERLTLAGCYPLLPYQPYLMSELDPLRTAFLIARLRPTTSQNLRPDDRPSPGKKCLPAG